MYSRNISLFGPRRILAIGLAGALLALAVALFAAAAVNTRTALGSGGGGGCFVPAGSPPACMFKTNAAFAHFGSVSLDKCTFTDLFVQPVQSLTSPGHTAATLVFISLSEFNNCNGTQLQVSNVDPLSFLPDFTGTIEFGNQLDSASVNGSTPMFDLNGNLVFTPAISITWLGFGPTSSFIDSNHFRAPGFLVNEHMQGTSREAMASGTLLDPASNNLAGTPTLDADLENDSGGSIFLSH